MKNPEAGDKPRDPHEQDRFIALNQVVDAYLDEDDEAFLAEIDDESERLGYVFKRLMELGEDPEEVLREYGVTEEHDEL